MIEIPWEGPSVIVPAEAIEVLHKFNHNYNHVPLIQCRDCTFGKAQKQCGCLVLMAVVKGYDMKDHKGFCYLAQLAEACQKTDKETAARADAEILKSTAHGACEQTMALGC